MKKSIESSCLKTTKVFAKEFAETILKSPKKKGALVLALKGELGVGKTSFIQGLAKGFCIKENVLSPTFLIIRGYELQAKSYEFFYHIDAYRLKNPNELLQLEWKEIVANPNNIVAIEWADNVKSIIPKDALWISFSYDKEGTTKRTINLNFN